MSIESRHRVEWVVEQNYKYKLSQFVDPLKRWISSGAGTCRSIPPCLMAAFAISLFSSNFFEQ